MKNTILLDIKTDVIQGHIPAAKDKLHRLQDSFNGDWITNAIITVADNYLTKIQISDEDHPSTIPVELALATLDHHIDVKDIEVKSDYGQEIYLPKSACLSLNLPYFPMDKDILIINIKASRVWESRMNKNEWDRHHKNILLRYSKPIDQYIRLESTARPGWSKIINNGEQHA